MDVTQGRGRHLIGANPTVNHPVAATWIKNAVEERHQADRLRPAPLRAGAPRAPLPAVQARHRRRAAQRDDARHRRAKAWSTRRSSPAARSATTSCAQNVAGYSPEAMAPICGIDAETIRDVARLFATSKGVDDPVGHGHLAARARHRQRALPDRAVADDRPDRPPRHRPASAARPEQRAGRVRRGPDPDDVPRLPARRPAPRRARASRAPGAWPRHARRPGRA